MNINDLGSMAESSRVLSIYIARKCQGKIGLLQLNAHIIAHNLGIKKHKEKTVRNSTNRITTNLLQLYGPIILSLQ